MGAPSSTDPDVRTRIRRQEVVAELGQRALECDDVDRFLHDAAATVAETLDADYCAVFERVPEGGAVLRRGVGWTTDRVGSETVSTDPGTQPGAALRADGPVVTDPGADERFGAADLLDDHDIAAGIGVRIGPSEEPWGLLGAYTTEPRSFAESDVDFVDRVGDLLESAVENLRTRSELEEVYGRISDAFFALDEEWRFTYLNERAHELINPDGRRLIGENVWEAFPEAVERQFKPAYERALYEQETTTFEEYYPEPLDVWFEVRAYPSETGLSVYFRDVTERRERGRALEQSEQRYRTLAEYFPNGIVTLFDHDLEYTLAAGRGFEELPVDPDDLEGRSFDDVWPAETADALRPAFRAALNGTEEAVELEYEGREWIVRAVPITDERGDVFAGMTMAQDVTERTERERELRERERRLERYREYTDAVLDAIDDVFYVVGEDGSLRQWNRSLAEVTGYTPAEIDSMEPTDFFPDGDAAAAADAIHEGFETGSVTVELPIARTDGSTVAFEFDASTLEDPWGNTVLAGIGRDVTERVERERDLERYEAIVEEVSDGVYVVDTDGRFTMVNETYAELVGYDPDELVGEHASLVVDDSVVERIEELEGAADADWPTMEADLRTADGDRVPIEASFAMLPDDDSDWHRAGIARDISDRKARERRLEESERRYRTLIDHFPNGAVGLYDEHLEYLVAGGEAFDELGIPESEVVGTTLEERYPDDLVAAVEPYFRAALEGESNTFEYRAHGRDVWAHTLPVRNDDGEIFAGMVMVQDVTERKEYRRRLEASNERLEQFAYAASHDLQEPLRMVTSYLQLLETRYGDAFDEDGEEFLAYAVDGAERMRAMIDGLLEYSRIETRGDPFEPTDLNAVLEDVLTDLELRIAETDAEITVDDLPRLEVDASQLRQVFQNLVGNALTYSGDEPPRVHVDAERRGDEVVVSVTDEGIGIDPADQNRIFSIFDRLHSRQEYEGTGIGLALCERIVERHGGEVWVDSEPGDGATFSFTLPADREE